MTHNEFLSLVEWLEQRWGKLHAGFDDIGAIFGDFASYPTSLVEEAAHDLYAEGKQSCPAPSVLLKRVREKTSNRALSAPNVPPEHCLRHRWAWEPIKGSDLRLGMCVLCGTEKKFRADQLQTPGELAAGTAAGEPKGGDQW